MAFRRPKSMRALIFCSSIGLALLSGGCGGGAPPSGTQVQDPPPISGEDDTAKLREQPPATKAPSRKAP